MFNKEKNIYIYETEEKPNKYAFFVLAAALFGIVACWIMNEVGAFHVDMQIMRIGAAITFTSMLIPFVMFVANKNNMRNPIMKYLIVVLSFIFTITTTTLMTFHTTLMLLLPVFIGMLYKSKTVAYMAISASILSAIISPVMSYVLGTWDVPLFQELILIATNGTAVIEGAYAGLSWLNIGKIVLYLVLPRLVVVVPCSILTVYVVNIGQVHVANQLELNRISHVDSLTGLYNRNYYNEVIEDPEFKGPVGVAYFDLNGLKTINDNFGHEAGDFLIQKSAKSITAVCDEHCGGFRLGGDEFILIFMGADEISMEKKMLNWKIALDSVNEEMNAEINEGYFDFHISIASGFVIGDFSNIKDLVDKADDIMYQNKIKMKEA